MKAIMHFYSPIQYGILTLHRNIYPKSETKAIMQIKIPLNIEMKLILQFYSTPYTAKPIITIMLQSVIPLD